MAGKSDPVRKYFLVSVVERWDPYEEAPYPPGAEVGRELRTSAFYGVSSARKVVLSLPTPYSSIGVTLSQICPLASP